MPRIGRSELDVFPIGLGGNVFGFTADRDTSFAILDAWVAGGADLIDTADSYSAWVPGNRGGESETIIGEWLAARRGARERVVIATKVAQHPEFRGLGAANVRAAAEASLGRLGIETIDLYYAHHDDPATSIAETVEAFASLVEDGLVRHVAVSNLPAERIEEWIAIAGDGPAAPVAIQPHYTLLRRREVEASLIPLAERHGMSLVPYFGLERGFLTGKYRSREAPADASPRAASAVELVTDESLELLDILDGVATARGVSMASVALAWLRHRPAVVAPLASASRVEQVPDLLEAGRLELSRAEVEALTEASDAAAS